MDCPACGSSVTLEVGPDRLLSTSLSDIVLTAEEDERIEGLRDCWDCGWHETRALRIASIDTTAGDDSPGTRNQPGDDRYGRRHGVTRNA